MAGLDPLSRGPAGASFDPRIAELAIPAADVAALRATLSTGDVVSAKVLPPSGGADFVEINGQKLAAALPSTVRPGDTLIIEVVAFEGDRLFVRNLGVDVSTGAPAETTTRTGPMFTPDLADELSPAVYSPRTIGAVPLPAGGTQQQPVVELPSRSSSLGGAYAPPAVAVTRPAGTPVYFISTGGTAAGVSSPASGPTPQAVPAAPQAPSAPSGAPPGPNVAAATAGVVARLPQLPGGTPPTAVLVAATVKQAGAGPQAGGPGQRQSPVIENGVDSGSLVEAKIAASRAAGSSLGEPLGTTARDAGAASAPARIVPTAQSSPALRQAATRSDLAGQIAQRAMIVPRSLVAGAAVASKVEAAVEAALESAVAEEPASEGAVPASEVAGSATPDAASRTSAAPAAEAAATVSAARAASTDTATVASPRAAASALEFAEPTALVRALNLPVTPTTVGAARLALARPQFLPEALSALERALPEGAADPRVSSLKTIAAYVTRLDPESPHFAQQLAAYVEHVVEGPEARVVSLLQTLASANEEPLVAQSAVAQPGDAASLQAASAPASGQPAPAGSTAAAGAEQTAPAATPVASRAAVEATRPQEAFPTPALPLGAGAATQASIVQRAISLAHDLKTQLQSFLESPPDATPSGALSAAQTALAAVTANQVNASLVAQQNPGQIALSVPLPFTGGRPAQITINRDAPDGKRALDGDNFHIGFILDTDHLGTVALDMQTVGRTVNVKVQAESELYAGTFSRSLGELETRLKSLRYNVAAMQAAVAPRGRPPVESTAPPGDTAPASEASASGNDEVAVIGVVDKRV